MRYVLFLAALVAAASLHGASAQCQRQLAGSLNNGDVLDLGLASWYGTAYGTVQFSWNCFTLSITKHGGVCRAPAFQLWACPSAFFSLSSGQGCILVADQTKGTSINNPGPQKWGHFFLYNSNSFCGWDYKVSLDYARAEGMVQCMNCAWWSGNQTGYSLCTQNKYQCTTDNSACWCTDNIQTNCNICPPWSAPLAPPPTPPTTPGCPIGYENYLYAGQAQWLATAGWTYHAPINSTSFTMSCFQLAVLAHGGNICLNNTWSLYACPLNNQFGPQFGCQLIANSATHAGGVGGVINAPWPNIFLQNNNPQCALTWINTASPSASFSPGNCAHCLWYLNDPSVDPATVCVNGQYLCNSVACWCSSGFVAYCPYYCPPWGNFSDSEMLAAAETIVKPIESLPKAGGVIVVHDDKVEIPLGFGYTTKRTELKVEKSEK